ncbi:mitochondrial ribosomal protein MRP51 [Paraphoma chrysanthemicola]|uniref:Mitochondrial ribosomal protein MRP51 n=1 Tax=Paraphoma chrysanthemicola TaxID=798071 RepID=A0A8K0QVZ7_9PLEO|nr:mitochondrial ribosomal protein MRP51 [Paraphoma chrysanthemicola]
MALRRQSRSPTANLLRNSRLFALPNPLPRPNVGETYGAGITRASDSATLPYPTHQAIATTKSSLARGDWGLKRPLPARSRLVQVSDPVLRVTQLDTIEHVTDFDSAADHVRTRQKWQELGVPMMRGLTQMRDTDLSGTPPGGAFERRDDTTSYDTNLGIDEAGLYLEALKENLKKNSARTQFHPFSPPPVDAEVHNSKRWKHDGPWLPGMNAQDFTAYLGKQISKRRDEFNDYLREFVKNEIYTTRQLAASKSGELAPEDIEEAQKWQEKRSRAWAKISEKDIQNGIEALRRETANNPLGSKLVTKLIMPFLRLPTIKFKYTAYAEDASNRDIDQYQFDQESAPLSTHPSAGLGYLRTKSYIANHPILGPQSAPSPVPARVVQPRTTAFKKEAYAKLGVGGFVANDQYRSTDTSSATRASISNARDVETIDIETPGGKKIPVQPMFGSVTNDGRIHIKLKRSTGAEIQVARGELDDKPPVRENYEPDPLKNLASFGRKSGVKELDEQSDRARQLSSFLEQMRPEREGRGTPAKGVPGVADALR